ncbi:MAG: hypothetical protein PHX34_01225 [Candidatus Shapirobacteria bacterium]|nr:hypothetical protein [Candidatus Shapirobacteria bacterium]
MMKIIKKLLKYLLLLIILLALTSSLWLKIIPQKYLSPFVGKSSIVDNVICNFSTKISGESMNPIITPGTSVDLNRCFKENDLTKNTIVMYLDNSDFRFGIIRHVLTLDPPVYKISDEKAPELLHDIIKEEIVGITHNIDVSKTKYETKQKTESFIFNPDEYLFNLYLGKIPRGYGIEMAEVEETTQFIKDKDKFCSVTSPKKKLLHVDTEIIDSKTNKVVTSAKDVILNVNSKPNIDCTDFGSDQGMLNLNPGNYQYKFSMNHQVLKNIPFIVN